MRRNGFLNFLFSLCPGAGQMYQGYMRRGLSLVVAFVVPIMVGASLLPVLMAFSAVVYMYSFFDSINLRAQIREYETGLRSDLPEDDFLLHMNLAQGDLQKLLSGKTHLIGWGLVILGVSGLYTTLVSPLLRDLVDLLGDSYLAGLLRDILYAVPQIAVGVIFVMVGFWLIRGSRKKPAEEDFERYYGEEDSHE